ncbi:unnamed protein product [Sphagnum balticum]
MRCCSATLLPVSGIRLSGFASIGLHRPLFLLPRSQHQKQTESYRDVLQVSPRFRKRFAFASHRTPDHCAALPLLDALAPSKGHHFLVGPDWQARVAGSGSAGRNPVGGDYAIACLPRSRTQTCLLKVG